MDRLEAMITIERYGNNLQCVRCGHTMPSMACEARPKLGEGAPCPLLVHYQNQEAHDDVLALAQGIRETQAAETVD